MRYADEAKAAASYFYDGSGVLKNKRDIRDARRLELTERAMVTAQAKNLPASIDLFSYNGFKELHRHLFGKLYEWAGGERNYTTGRGAASFARPEYIGSWIEKQFQRLNEIDPLRLKEPEFFATRLADIVNEMNAAHPFVEGNGRTTRLWLQQIALRFGHAIDYEHIQRQEWYKAAEIGFEKADPTKLVELLGRSLGKTQGIVSAEQPIEGLGPQAGESLIAQLDSAVSQAEQLRDQQVQQEYSDQLGIYVQEKAEQIDRLQSNLAAALTSEKAQLQAIRQSPPGWTAGKKARVQWEQQVVRRTTRIAQIAQRVDRVGEIEEAAGVYAATKIEELAELKLRFDHPELAQEWDKIQRREREAAIPKIGQNRSLTEDLVQSLNLHRTPENDG